ncbi:Mur ligase family protein, partial [Achromobacter xylosoxidans]
LPDGQTLGGHLTTPDVLTVHRLLAAMRDAGAKAVAMEASSIGIEQGRMDGVRVALAAYTNLTRDHLDYHGTMER